MSDAIQSCGSTGQSAVIENGWGDSRSRQDPEAPASSGKHEFLCKIQKRLNEPFHEVRTGRVDEVHRIISDVGISVPGLGVGGLTQNRIRRAEPAESTNVKTGHGIVESGLGIAIIGREEEFRGVRCIPLFPVWIVALFADFRATYVGAHSYRKMVRMMISRG